LTNKAQIRVTPILKLIIRSSVPYLCLLSRKS
jgi:hypothetical protein